MATAPGTYITPELQAKVGKTLAKHVSDPISASDIKKWAIAVYYPEEPPRLYWDTEYAKKARFGGIVAPWEFNSFTWPIQPRSYSLEVLQVSGGVGGRILNGGAECEYYARMRPGDVITNTVTLLPLTERKGRLGLMLFVTRENRWTNQKGDLVKIARATSIIY